MHHKGVSAAVTAVTTAALLVSCSPTSRGGGKISDGGIKLGVLTDMSGVYSSRVGKKSVAAVQMAIDDFKAKYGDKAVTGNISLVSGDHQNKPEVASTQAREMYERQRVDAIFDVPTSSAALAVATLAQQTKRLHFNTAAATQDLTGKACNRYTYAWAFDAYMIAKGTGGTVTQRGGKDWYLLYPDYVFGQGMQTLFSSMIKGANGNVIASDPTPFPGSDYSTFLLKAANSKPRPDVLGALQAGDDLVNLVKQYNQYGLRDKGIQLAVGLLAEEDIKAIGSKSLQGTVFTTAWFWNLDDESRAFAKKFKAKTGELPNFLTAANYSAATQYLEAVQRTGTDDSDTVVKALDGRTFSDAFARNAEIRAADHRVTHDAYLASVKAPGEVTNPDDLTKLVTTIPADEAFEPASPECDLT
ncbi:ABC transporter substrate-binding protein [Streptomyces sp. NPDC002668]|uniref:ABC transporter substrate-binding protein n=1 Tax=Streptomyces sp. NPDC002668 TaxID=3154422 RepID=UPI00333129F7